MKSKWSSVIKPDDTRIHVEAFEMSELIPFVIGQSPSRTPMELEEPDEPEPIDETPLPHDCTALQREAFDAGHAAGVEEGTRVCREHAQQELAKALALVGQVETARAEAMAAMEQTLYDAAFAIVKRVIHREASINKDVVTRQIREAVKCLTHEGALRILVHPSEVEAVQAIQGTLTTETGAPLASVIEADDTVDPGGCQIHTPTLTIDASISHQLDVMMDAVRPYRNAHEPSTTPATT